MISDYIEELYDRALEMGIEPSLFWNSSIAEIHDLISVAQKRKMAEFKQIVSLMELHIDLTAQRTAKIMGNKDIELTSIMEDLVPELFEEEMARKEQEKQMAASIAYTEKFKKYARQHNKKFKEVTKQ